MDARRWERMQAVFHEATALSAAERPAFLDKACTDDPAMLADILTLLEEDAGRSSLLDRGVADIAREMLDDGGLAGKEFGPYRIKSVLGEGGMGVVYLAERDDLGNLVAIKVLRDAWLSPARRERFTSEQRMLAQLNHPSIARLYDADTLADGTPWFAMEYVEGLPLTEYCKRRESPIEERLQLFRAVCDAVQYAHSHALIHRDLKPSNILVRDDGSVRLLDFGIAKQLEDGNADRTRTGLRLMTPAYAAPEQIRGERTGIQSDVYSLGVILYELLAGKLPYDLSDRTPAEAEILITQQEPRKPSLEAERMLEFAAGGAAWADLDVLCLTAMHKDLQRRYRSVEALRRDVDHYLHGEPLEARPDTSRYRMGKFVGRNRRAVFTAAGLVLAIFAMVIFFTVRLTIARNLALAEAARTQRIQRFMLRLFEGGDKEVGPADNLRVVTLIDRGVQEARALDSEPAVQAELYQTLGGIYQQLGKFDQADSLLRAALDKRKSISGADSAEVADSMTALGLLRLDQARVDEAEQLTRDGLAMAKRHLPPGHPAVAKATLDYGKALRERGKYDEAVQVDDEAVRLRSAGVPASPDLAASLSELATVHFLAGHYPISDSLNRRALAMHRQLFGDRHPLLADDMLNLGHVQFQLGHYAEAERFDRQALTITEPWYGKDHLKTAANLNEIGQVLVYENRFDEGEDFLRQALAIRERIYGSVHPAVASTLNELGGLALQRDHWDEAEAYFRRMIDIYRAVYHDHHYLIGIGLSNLGSVYLDRKDFPRAEQLYRESIQRLTDTLPADHLHTAIVRIKLGRALVRQHKYSDAIEESLAGYRILTKQTSPSVSFLRGARKDLVEAYDALKQPQEAQKYRAELEAGTPKPAQAAGKK